MWVLQLQAMLAPTVPTVPMLQSQVEPVKTEPMAELTPKVAQPGKPVVMPRVACLETRERMARMAQRVLMGSVAVPADWVILD